jgi:putative ABC transport system permease protein
MSWLADLSQAVRRWRARPAFAATAILTLTLGIGVATAIFSVVDGVLLRPLPWPESDRLVSVWIVRPHWRLSPGLAASADRGVLSWPNFRELQQQNRTLESVAIWSTARPILDGPVPQQVHAMRVSSTFLDTLKVRVMAGRNFFATEDDDPTDSLIVSYEAWQRRFGGEPHILGRRVSLDEVSKVIVGVLPPRFRFEGQPPEFLLPVGQANKADRNRGNHNHRGILRLKQGISLEQAHADTEPILRFQEDPKQRTSRLQPLADQQLGEAKRPLLILLGGAVLLLLVACANVAGLLLGDATSRRHELAVRAALGAGRRRIIRQLLVESAALAVAAAAAGLMVAWALKPALVALAPDRLPRLDTIAIDLRVLGFAALLGLVTTLICGAGAALNLASSDPAAALSEGGRSGTRRQRAQGAIVIAEIALALVLLVGASLFGETVRRMSAQPVGFDASNLVVIGIREPRSMSAGSAPAALAARVAEIEGRLSAVPGVVSVAGVSSAPFGGGYGSNNIEIEGKKLDPSPSARRHIVTESFFRTMAMPLLRGRVFDRSDSSSARLVVVSQEFERRYMDGYAVGKRFRLNQDWLEVIGVVANTKQLELTDEDEPGFFALRRQLAGWSVNQYVVRSSGDAAALIPSLREAVRAYDARLIVSTADTMDTLVKRSIAEERYRALLLGMFGGTALLLAAIGVYGLLARDVADRRREIGVRMALGATAFDVMRLVSRQGLTLVAFGLLIGIPAALGAGRLIRSMLYGVSPAAPAVFGAVAAALAFAALCATVIPARRASHIDPIVSLRGD